MWKQQSTLLTKFFSSSFRKSSGSGIINNNNLLNNNKNSFFTLYQSLSTTSKQLNHSYATIQTKNSLEKITENSSNNNSNNNFNNKNTKLENNKLENTKLENNNNSINIGNNNNKILNVQEKLNELHEERLEKSFSSGKIYNEKEFTIGLQQLIQKSHVLSRELKREEEELQNTLQNSLQNNTQESNKKEINTKFINDTDATLKTLLIRSVTHISYGSGKVRSNDRLPYIGNFILDLILNEYLINKYLLNEKNIKVIQLIKGIYSNKSFLSFIVANDYLNLLNHSENTLQNNTLQNNSLQNNNLQQTRLNLKMNHLKNMYQKKNEHFTLRIYGWNEMTLNSKHLILSNVILSLIGSIYLKCGINICKEFIEEIIIKELPNIIFKKLLLLDEPYLILSDIIFSMYNTTLKSHEEFIEELNCYKCNLFIRNQIIGSSNAKDLVKARKLAAFDGLMNLQSLVPNF
ncbi:hypothetical protein ABK040_016165 [Willaertia magna]